MRVATFYFFVFGAVGVILPYLPLYLRSLGLGGKAIGLATSIPLFLMIVAPPLWGYAADRTRRVVRVLQIVCAGATLGFAPMLSVRSLVGVLLTMGAYGVFHSTISALADAVAVTEARRLGTDYARLRLWGSVGFVITSYGFGFALDRGMGVDAVPAVSLGLLAGMTLASLSLPRGAQPPRIASPLEAAGLLRRRDLLLFFGAAMLHWAALSPFHILFALHFQDLGLSGQVVGLGLAVAVTAEVSMMWGFRHVARRLDLPPLLSWTFLASALRWALTAFLHDPILLVAAQVLHGLSFGAFFIASILILERRVAPELLATGRALFSSVVMGVGGIGGNLLAGVLYDAGGGELAFASAAMLDAAAGLLLAAFLLRRRRSAARASA